MYFKIKIIYIKGENMKKLIIIISTTLFLFTFVSCAKTQDSPIQPRDEISQISDSFIKVNYTDLKDLPMTKENLKLIINGQEISLSSPIYLDKNRYYLCLNDIVYNLNGTIKREDNNLLLSLLEQSITINLSNNKFKNSDVETQIKKPLIAQDDFYYIDFSDLSNLLDMYTRWDVSSKTIMCKTFGNSMENIKNYTSKIDTLGFLRLEDITLPTQSYDKEFLEKIRIIGNYLSKRNVPYHIAWIPRYTAPLQNIDIDPMTTNDFNNAELVYTFDFFTTHNGLIGLHGYTHQSGTEESAVGTEFGTTQPSTSRFKERIEKGIETAKYLDIPLSFFETPHYAITPEQNKIAENYFKILYYPYTDNGAKSTDLTKPQLSPYNSSSYYISTPLEYIPSNNVKGALDKLKKCDTTKMGSIFYHPRLEFDFIKLSLDNNIPNFTYSDDSTLKNLISILEEKGFKMSKVTDIK